MHLITLKKLRELQLSYPDSAELLSAWADTVKSEDWKSMDDLRETYRTAKIGDRDRHVGFVFPDGTLYALITFKPGRPHDTGNVMIVAFEEPE